MEITGITGQTGAGKSFLGCYIAQSTGGILLCADKTAHELTKRGGAGFDEIVEAFGGGILDGNGEIDRKKLGAEVFNDGQKLKLLEGIIHPRVFAEFQGMIAVKTRNDGAGYVVLDVPLLFEAGFEVLCDRVIVVCADEETRIKRIIRRDGLTADEAALRVKARKTNPADYARENDLIVSNNGAEEELLAKVRQWLGF
jgi:dephospho-CoA kinase